MIGLEATIASLQSRGRVLDWVEPGAWTNPFNPELQRVLNVRDRA